MNKINDIPQREIKNKNEQMWFSYLVKEIEKAEYGSIEIKLTIRAGKVVNIKNRVESNFPLDN